MQQNRYFIGITLPEDITKQIAIARHKVYVPQTMLAPLQPHITLLHPNALMKLPMENFTPEVRDTALQFLPIKITLTELGWFDTRVLHIKAASDQLQKLQNALVNLLPQDVRANYYASREFTPHVTLSQAKPYQKLPDSLFRTYHQHLGSLLPYTFTATQLTKFLWQSPRHYKIELI